MAIKDGFIKTKRRRKLADGDYQTVSEWTSATTVETSEGSDLQTKLDDHIELKVNTLNITGYNSSTGKAYGGTVIPMSSTGLDYVTNKQYAEAISEMCQYDLPTAINEGNSADRTVTFTSDDSTTSLSSTPPALITSGETHKSLFNKISTAVKNVRWLLSKMGTTDLSGIGDGTVTNAISTLNSNINNGTELAFKESIFTHKRKELYKKGNNVYLSFNNAIERQFTTNTCIATVPDSVKPIIDVVRFPVFETSSHNYIGRMELLKDGNIYFYSKDNSEHSNMWVCGYVQWTI